MATRTKNWIEQSHRMKEPHSQIHRIPLHRQQTTGKWNLFFFLNFHSLMNLSPTQPTPPCRSSPSTELGSLHCDSFPLAVHFTRGSAYMPLILFKYLGKTQLLTGTLDHWYLGWFCTLSSIISRSTSFLIKWKITFHCTCAPFLLHVTFSQPRSSITCDPGIFNLNLKIDTLMILNSKFRASTNYLFELIRCK